jgi:putrescine aminotransferase
VTPDIVTLSKSLGSGVVPVSAAVTNERVWKRAFSSRDRFDLAISTFGGNPAACAAVLKTTEIMLRDGIPGRAQALGEHARERLEALKARHELVRDVRGRGLLLGIELAADGRFAEAKAENLALMVIGALLHEHGILTSYFDFDPKVIRFEPPLVATREQVDEAVDAFDRVLSKGAKALALAFGKSVIGRMMHH